jgi:hypothetical protein
MRVLVKEATAEALLGLCGAITRLAPNSEGFREQALSGLIASVEAMQDRAHEWNRAENRNLQTVW